MDYIRIMAFCFTNQIAHRRSFHDLEGIKRMFLTRDEKTLRADRKEGVRLNIPSDYNISRLYRIGWFIFILKSQR